MLRREGRFSRADATVLCWLHTFYLQSTHSLLTVYSQSTHSLLTVYLQSTYSLLTVYSQSTDKSTFSLRQRRSFCDFRHAGGAEAVDADGATGGEGGGEEEEEDDEGDSDGVGDGDGDGGGGACCGGPAMAAAPEALVDDGSSTHEYQERHEREMADRDTYEMLDGSDADRLELIAMGFSSAAVDRAIADAGGDLAGAAERLGVG